MIWLIFFSLSRENTKEKYGLKKSAMHWDHKTSLSIKSTACTYRDTYTHAMRRIFFLPQTHTHNNSHNSNDALECEWSERRMAKKCIILKSYHHDMHSYVCDTCMLCVLSAWCIPPCARCSHPDTFNVSNFTCWIQYVERAYSLD